ncbi:MAG: carboxypeptidase-like regulatory domain-containing protein [Chitinophagaceae bacterium]|nr:carboxypeptidase-like regulatory domain-containing protein [Chitinophagaceae bacterium]
MRFSFVFLGIILIQMAMGQVKINGTVKDHKGKPISGVSVSLKDTYDGSTSDSLGHYSFETTEKGSFLLEASCLGYGSYMVNLQIDNKDLSNNIVLKKLITDLEAVVISAGTFEASDKKKGTVLTSLDIVTTAGADGDVTGALKTLPGTQQVGETGGLFCERRHGNRK